MSNVLKTSLLWHKQKCFRHTTKEERRWPLAEAACKELCPYTQPTKVRAEVTSLDMEKASGAKRRRRTTLRLVQHERKRKDSDAPASFVNHMCNFVGMFVNSYDAVQLCYK